MKILMFSTDRTLESETSRATGPFRQVLSSLSARLAEIHVICKSSRSAVRPWLLNDNVRVYPIKRFGILDSLFKSLRAGIRVSRQIRIDLISSQDVLECGIPAYMLSKLFGKPLLLELHGDYLDNELWLRERLLNRIGNPLGKWLLRRASLVRVTSKTLEAKVAIMGIPSSRVFYLPHRTDTDRFKPSAPSARLKAKLGLEAEKVILFVGRLSWEKRVPDAIEVLAEIKKHRADSHLVLIGKGAEKGSVLKLIAERGLEGEVTYIEQVPNEELPEYYSLANVFLLTSEFEGRPRVVQEALSSGVPVVSTAVSGVDELVKEGQNGFITPIGDIAALSAAILKILEDPELEKRMRLNARETMEGDFTWPRGINSMVEMYEEASQSGTARYDAHYYEHIAAFSNRARYREELDYLCARLALGRGEKLLDIGCGTGAAMRHLQRNYAARCSGFEVSDATRTHTADLDVIYGDSGKLPFPDDCFDVITILHVIGHMDEVPARLYEAHRVLKPGGRIGIITPNRYFVYAHRPLNKLGFIPYRPDLTVRKYYTSTGLSQEMAPYFTQLSCEYFGRPPRFLERFVPSCNFLKERVIYVGRKT